MVPNTCVALDAHPSTPSFGAMPHTRKLDCANECNQVVFCDESIFIFSSDDNRVRVWRHSGERLNPASALQRHTAPTAVICPWHPATTCVVIHATAARSPFSTRQCSASHGKGVMKLSPHCYYPSLACPIPRFVPIEHIWDHLGRKGGHPMSFNKLEARLQQIWN
ncbi:uncharacterized protein TNCV_2096441 [Trichonephila clavipes]|nr:uncharacterized protein TNCV_2096441 [Trichonephila clavipes]